MKFFLILFLAAILVFASFQLYQLIDQKNELTKRSDELGLQMKALEAENAKLEQDLEYYRQDPNLAKESTAQFNYKKPDEKLFILVPSTTNESR